jgi:hypothetical protein
MIFLEAWCFRARNQWPSSHSAPTGIAGCQFGRQRELFGCCSGHPVGTYQWRFNGSTIGGATRDALLLTNVTSASEGNYSVVLNNSSGSVTSAPAKLYWDSAGDGLPDSWKIQYFGTTNVTAASDAPLRDEHFSKSPRKFPTGFNPPNARGLKPRLILQA